MVDTGHGGGDGDFVCIGPAARVITMGCISQRWAELRDCRIGGLRPFSTDGTEVLHACSIVRPMEVMLTVLPSTGYGHCDMPRCCKYLLCAEHEYTCLVDYGDLVHPL